jgi:hypothetical protein
MLDLKLLRVSDGSGALFLRGVSATKKKAGTYSTTRSFYAGSRPNLNNNIVGFNQKNANLSVIF